MRGRRVFAALGLGFLLVGLGTGVAGASASPGWSYLCDKPLSVLTTSRNERAFYALSYQPCRPGLKPEEQTLLRFSLVEGDAPRRQEIPHAVTQVLCGQREVQYATAQVPENTLTWALNARGLDSLAPYGLGGQLAFSDGQGIWLEGVGKGLARRITSDPTWDTQVIRPEGWIPKWAYRPAWSADRSLLFFETNRRGLDEVWEVEVTNGVEQAVYREDEPGLCFLGVRSDGALLVSTLSGFKIMSPASGSAEMIKPGRGVAFWDSGHDAIAIVDSTENVVCFSSLAGEFSFTSHLSDYRLSPIAGSWSPDGSRFCTLATKPGRDADGHKQSVLLVLNLSSGTAIEEAVVSAPPGYEFDERIPSGWTDSGGILMVLSKSGAAAPTYVSWRYSIMESVPEQSVGSAVSQRCRD